MPRKACYRTLENKQQHEEQETQEIDNVNVVEKCKEGLGCKTKSQALNVSQNTVQSSENKKTMVELQTCRDVTV